MSIDGVFLSGRECASLWRILRAAQRHLRNDGLDLPLIEAAEQVRQAAGAYELTVRRAVRDVATLTRETSVGVGGFAATCSEWISTAEAAAVIRCSEQFARRLARDGVVKARREGKGAWELDAVDVRRYAEQRSTSVRSRPRKAA